MTTVAVVNQHTNNYGDDAAGVALVEAAFRELDARQVDVFYIWHKKGKGLPLDSKDCSHHYPEVLSGQRDVRIRLVFVILGRLVFGRLLDAELRQLVNVCKKADVVFVSPCGANIGIYKDWTYLLVLLALVLDGVKPTFYQNTIGSSSSKLFNSLALFVLRRSALSVREVASLNWLASKSLSAYLGVDTALMLGDVHGPSSEPRYIAVVPTRLSNWHRDFRKFDDGVVLRDQLPVALRDVALSRGLDIVIVPHLYGAEQESDTLHRMRDMLRALGCRATVADTSTYDDYRRWLAGSEAVISMRYHGLVLAAHSGVPCVSLAYENKMAEAAAYLGVPELAINVATASASEIRSRIEYALDHAASLREKMLQRKSRLRLIAMGPMLAASSQLLRSSG